jgi:hypothetical protein
MNIGLGFIRKMNRAVFYFAYRSDGSSHQMAAGDQVQRETRPHKNRALETNSSGRARPSNSLWRAVLTESRFDYFPYLTSYLVVRETAMQRKGFCNFKHTIGQCHTP